MQHYRAPLWTAGSGPLGGHIQTIWPALFSRAQSGSTRELTPGSEQGHLPYVRQRWATPDGDFVDVDTLIPSQWQPGQSPVLVLFHGLEGSSQSHYARAFGHWAAEQGYAYVVPHFRGCSGEPNVAPRFYHSGDYAEIGWMLQRVVALWGGPVWAVGVSLGGNALLRWAQEAGSTAGDIASAVVAVSSPIDLAAAGHAIGTGFNRLAYNRMFLQTLKPKALAKLDVYPGLFDRQALLAARDLYEYDNVVTAPLHGFANTEDYWARCSAKPGLRDMKHVPALVINALNDPFVPAGSLPRVQDVGEAVTLWQPPHGGHVGFPAGRPPGHVATLPQAVANWLMQQNKRTHHG
jgi:predicted alpha/beta-fold hydrolase